MCDSTAVVVRPRPRAILLAMITMKTYIHIKYEAPLGDLLSRRSSAISGNADCEKKKMRNNFSLRELKRMKVDESRDVRFKIGLATVMQLLYT